jgi:hypothetical protein
VAAFVTKGQPSGSALLNGYQLAVRQQFVDPVAIGPSDLVAHFPPVSHRILRRWEPLCPSAVVIKAPKPRFVTIDEERGIVGDELKTLPACDGRGLAEQDRSLDGGGGYRDPGAIAPPMLWGSIPAGRSPQCKE